ncbi:Ig-like domain repeat protein [Candidatus Woesearchaeota archaeon]|nr:Ig-like domain repeat protein [Candidatus Woesearchaeota archaeon]
MSKQGHNKDREDNHTHTYSASNPASKLLMLPIILLVMMLVASTQAASATLWWNTTYTYRQQVNVSNNMASIIPTGYTINLTLDTTGSHFLASGDDLRIVYWNGTSNTELDRINTSSFNSATTTIRFKVQKNISASGSDSNYFIYYGAASASNPPTNKSKVYLWYDDFNRANNTNISNEAAYDQTGGGVWALVNNQLRNTGGIGDPNKLLVATLGSNVSDVEMMVKMNVTTWLGTADEGRMGLSQDMDATGGGYASLFHNNQTSLEFLNDLRSWGLSSTFNWNTNTWYYMKFRVINPSGNSGNYKVWAATGTEPSSWTAGTFGTGDVRGNGYVGLAGSRRADVTYFDDFQIRYVVSTEPTTSNKSEENNTAPSIMLDSGTTAEGYFNQTWIDANITVSSIYLDSIIARLYNGSGSLVSSNTSTTSPALTNFTGLPEGIYYLNATANDTRGISNFTETRTIVLDTTKPTNDFESGTEDDNAYFNRDWIYVDLTAYDLNEENVTFSLFNTSGPVMTNVTGAGNRSINWTSLSSNMVYWYNVTVADKAGNQNTTETRKITLDTMTPSMSVSGGTESSGSFRSRSWIYFNVTAYDLNEENVTFALYNESGAPVNVTTLGAGNRSINWTSLQEGTYYYNATIFDKAGLRNETTTLNITLDTTKPGIELNSTTTNEGFSIQDWINALIDAIDSFLESIQIFLFNSDNVLINSTNSSTPQASMNVTGLADGVYYLNATANDSAGNFNSTTTRTITLDTTLPEMDFSGGTEDIQTFWSRDWIYVNISANDTNEANVTFSLYNSTGSGVNMTTLGAANRSINWTSLTDGTYYYNATIFDLAGMSNSTSTRNITLDTLKPEIGLELQTTASGYKVQDWIFINMTATDLYLNLMQAFLYNGSGLVNSSNSTSSPLAVNFTSLPDGVYYINATANDSARNENITETRTVILDTTYPAVDFSGGTSGNETFWNRNWIYLNLSAYDENEENVTFSLYNASGSAVDVTTLGAGNRSINWTSLQEGTYHYNATIDDKAGLENSTGTLTITLDGNNPSIEYSGGTEEDDVYLDKDWIYVNVSAYDLNEANVTFSLFNSSGPVMANATGAGNRSINWTSLNSNMAYWYNVTIVDAVDNQNTSQTRKITLDSLDPTIAFSGGTEEDGVFRARDWIYVNVSAYDTNEANLTFYLYNSSGSGLNATNLSAGNRNINFTSLAEGTYYYNVTIRDRAGHFANTTTQSITLDSQAPVLIYESGTESNNTFVSRDWLAVNVSASDAHLNVINASLFESAGSLVDSNTSTSSPHLTNFSDLGEGTYYINATANDSVGNIGTIGLLNVTVDLTYPSIDYGEGTPPDGNVTNSTWLYVNVTAYDLNEENVTFYLYNGSGSQLNATTLPSGTRSLNFSGLIGGLHYYNVTIRDKAGLENYTATRNITIVIDSTAPNISFKPETTASGYWSQDWISANVSAEDNLELGRISVTLYNSSAGLVNSTNSSTSPYFVNITGLADGLYYLNASAYDTASNSNKTETRTIILDTVLPAVSIGSTTEDNNALAFKDWIYLDITASDSNEENVTFSLFNSSGPVMTNVTGAGNRSINWTGLNGDMEYWYNATVTDKAGNQNTTETRKITLDTTPVVISFESETTASGSKSQDWISANVTASSSGLDTIMIYLYNSTGSLVDSTQGSSSPLYANYTSLEVGTYFLNASANDSRGIDNATETRVISLGGFMSVQLESPGDNAGDGDGAVTFLYNVTGTGVLANCSLVLDGAVDQTDNAPAKGVTLNFTKTGLTSGSYDWMVNCSDTFGLEEVSSTRSIDVILLTGFGGDTTNVSEESDLSSMTNFTLQKPGLGKIVFKDPVNLTGGSDLASIVQMGGNWTSVDSASEPRLNLSATIELSGLTYVETPVVLVDGGICPDCDINYYDSGNLSFNVTHFSNYTAAANAQLLIWDGSDLEREEVNDNVVFYANYSNTTTGNPITGSAWCNITFEDTGSLGMTYNAGTGLYEYPRVFSSDGFKQYNVTCDASAQRYEVLTLYDSAIIAPDFYGPRNNSNQYYVRVTVNITQAIPEILNISCNDNDDITLNPGSSQKVWCSVLVRDWGGGNTIQAVNATLYYALNASWDPDDNNVHYTNDTCTWNNTDGYNATWDCAFDVWYYANNGTWIINATAQDDFPYNVSSTAYASILPMYALNVTDVIDFGDMYVGEISSSLVQANVTNFGNMDINVSVYGFGGEDESGGAGTSLVCEQRNISIANERYSLDSLDSWGTMTPISGVSTQLPWLTMPQQTDDFSYVMNATYWSLFVDPSDNPFGQCNGTVIFSAEAIS